MASDQLRFDGKVVIVTGAGAGLGKAYALLFASRGAKVVVNDLGGTRSGDGSSSNVADSVVNEIVANGGTAVADYNSVTEGEKIVQTALDNYGRIDIVVNNAGILRDKSFARISDMDWDIIQNVHLKGAFKTSQAAWPHMRKQNYGRFIVTSSNSGLYGNFGQANYSAAKMGLVGLCNTMSIEGRKYGINCNVIVPTAASRLTQDILPPDVFAELKPELIAPVVAWLCHESCDESGSVIESAAGWATKYSLVRGPGKMLRHKVGQIVTPEDVQTNWDKITDLSTFENLSSIEEATGTLMTYMERMKNGASETERLQETMEHTIVFKDCIIYALSIGASVIKPSDMKYLYENDEQFCCFPTMAIIPGQMAVMTSGIMLDAIPGKQFDLSQILHGEQYLEVYKPLPTDGKIRNECKIIEVLDKGRNAIVVVGVHSFNESGEELCYGEMTVVVVNGGGFGGQRTMTKGKGAEAPPSRKPDTVVVSPTNKDQAVLYRLNGDLNPLHIDPNFAQLGGFNRPILHGLCSLGVSVKHVVDTYAGGNPALFKSVKVRFTSPVYPGDELMTEMWREGKKIYFRTKSSNNEVISGAYVELHDINEAKTVSPMKHLNKNDQLKSDAIFHVMRDTVKSRPEICKRINGVFLYKVLMNGKEAGIWTIDLVGGDVYQGEPKIGVKVNTTMIMEDEDIIKMAAGTLNPQSAFMKGLLKITGNIMLAQKLKDLMKVQPKM